VKGAFNQSQDSAKGGFLEDKNYPRFFTSVRLRSAISLFPTADSTSNEEKRTLKDFLIFQWGIFGSHPYLQETW